MYVSPIATPHGPIGFEFAIGGARLGEALCDGVRDSGWHRAEWAPLGGVTVTLDVVPLTNFSGIFARPDDSHHIDQWWGAIARFQIAQTSGPLEMRASVLGDAQSGWSTGQSLAARAFSAGDAHSGELSVLLGGPDSEFLEDAVQRGDLPARWAGVFDDSVPQRGYGVSDWLPPGTSTLAPDDRGVGWRVPGGRAGEAVELHCSVAWGTGENASTMAWFAVETSPAGIRAHAAAGH